MSLQARVHGPPDVGSSLGHLVGGPWTNSRDRRFDGAIRDRIQDLLSYGAVDTNPADADAMPGAAMASAAAFLGATGYIGFQAQDCDALKLGFGGSEGRQLLSIEMFQNERIRQPDVAALGYSNLLKACLMNQREIALPLHGAGNAANMEFGG